MMFIVTLHILGQGGVLYATINNPINHKIVWVFETAAYCAVNCYALISGFVAGNRNMPRFKYSNILILWLQVLFYTITITVIFAIIKPGSIGKDQILGAIFPVFKDQYWYFTAYFCMYFFTPILNLAIHKLSRKQFILTIIISVLMFSFYTTFSGDIFKTSLGYSALWLSLLYLFGGFISKHKILFNLPKFAWLLLYIISVTITWVARFYIKNGFRLTDYTSPTILVAGYSLLMFFCNMKLQPVKNIIKFLSPLSFSVYLIHTHPLMWTYFMANRYAYFAEFPIWKLMLGIICSTLVIYLLCSAIDLIRHYLFKLLKIKKLLEKAEAKILKETWLNLE